MCVRIRACVCVRLRVGAHACTRDDASVYACGAHAGALAGALPDVDVRACACMHV